MFSLGRWRAAFLSVAVLLGSALTGTVANAVPVSVPDDAAQLLRKADSLKTSNYAEFSALMRRIGGQAAGLSPEQRLYLRYLDAWQVAYHGDYATAIPELNTVIADSSDVTLRFRAGLTAVNLLGIATRYEEAFSRLNQLLELLPQVNDREARIQALGTAAQLYVEAGQYDLAAGYADRLIKDDPGNENTCKGGYLKLEALYRSGRFSSIYKQFQDAIAACVVAGEPIFANGMRAHMASYDIQHGQPAAAIKLLQKNYADVQHTHYARLVSQFDALLAQAYLKEGTLGLAQQYALDAVNSSVKNEYTQPLTSAYEVLYLIAERRGDMGAALAYHERYMGADKGYLNDVSAKALAYQTVKQQVLAKKLLIDTLDKQNRILKLQGELDQKAIVTTRLYTLLLLTVLAFIAFWAYRIKRSQLRFMKLARRDGLTGIFNRQHFVSVAEQQLQYCRKSAREASLVLIDLDHFKVVNDTHGHAVGDRVLRRAVEACQSHLRSTDIFGRLGGEEFGILLPECSLEQVVARAEQIRQAIAAVSADENMPSIPISASFGVSTAMRSGYDLRQLLIHADAALYRAKRAGRNRVGVCESAEDCLKTA